LKKVILNDQEWDLLDELCNILAPFEKATRDFSGNTYVTLSKMVPIITNLTNSLESSSDIQEDEESYHDDSDDTISSANDLEDVEDILADHINYNDITKILKNVKKNIYLGLKHYWKVPNEFGIMASLLDPRYKNLSFISDNDIKQKIHSTLQAQYDQLKWEMNQQSIPSSPTTITTDPTSSIAESSTTAGSSTPSRSLHEHKARCEQRTKKILQIKETTSMAEDEITVYFLMPIVRENKNPLDWWRAK